MLMDYVAKAKKGDTEAYKYLYDYYYKSFVKKIVKKYGIEYEEKAKEKFPEIIDHYLRSDKREKISNYFCRMIREKNIFEENPKSRIYYVNSRLNDLTDQHFNELVDRYSNSLYQKIKGYNSILSDDDIKGLSRKMISTYLKKFVDNYDVNTVPVLINIIVHDEVNFYKKDSENIIKRYLKYFDATDNIYNYIKNKYYYLIEENSKNKFYHILKDNYSEIIINALKKFKSSNTCFSFKGLIKNEIKIIKTNYNKEFERMERNKDSIVKNKEYLRKSYDYIIRQYYDMYKDSIKSNYLLNMITDKYNEFFDCYINLNSESPISKYITTRLSEYLIKLSKYNVDCIDCQQIQKNIVNYSYIILKAQKKYTGYYPIQNEMRKIYIECCYNYYETLRKTTFEEYVSVKLMNITRLLSKKYDDNYLENIINSFINCNLIPKELRREYFNELKVFYINNKLYEKITFDKYLICEINNFNYDEYLKIRDIGEKINNKVLKRP